MKVRGVGAAKNEAANLRRPHKLKKIKRSVSPLTQSALIPSQRVDIIAIQGTEATQCDQQPL
jgi:hypothetical protein